MGIEEYIDSLVLDHQMARERKDYKQADEIRDYLKLNYKVVVESLRNGRSRWRYE